MWRVTLPCGTLRAYWDGKKKLPLILALHGGGLDEDNMLSRGFLLDRSRITRRPEPSYARPETTPGALAPALCVDPQRVGRMSPPQFPGSRQST